MSGNGKAGNGRGNRRRHFKRNNSQDKNKTPANVNQQNSRNDESNSKVQSPARTQSYKRAPNIERQRWVPPKLNTSALPVIDCSWCGKPIRDISQAISDKTSGVPIHFECVTERIAEHERLEKGDTITYIGGGRFGIVSFSQPPQSGGSGAFKIKKIIEWENNENRALWRDEIREHFSVT